MHKIGIVSFRRIISTNIYTNIANAFTHTVYNSLEIEMELCEKK